MSNKLAQRVHFVSTPPAGEDFLQQLRRVNGERWKAWAQSDEPDPLYMSNEFGGEAGESIPRCWSTHAEPHAAWLLEICWREELLTECRRPRIAATGRTNIPTMIRDMSLLMTGREIAQAVCRQLRMRSFPEADAPVYEERSAA
ncbi:MAG: hypothetical protein J7530_07925 [Novosphingobium sp.]|nr:hypothetical protein [Novosphingobium sp.]